MSACVDFMRLSTVGAGLMQWPVAAHAGGARYAIYAFEIANAHAFVDGNKRTAFVTSVTFLRLNGWHFVTEPAQGVASMEDLTSGVVSEEKFGNWLEAGSTEIQ